MRWEQGRTVIERMLTDGELQRVPASRAQADRLLAKHESMWLRRSRCATTTRPGATHSRMTAPARP